jgi:CHAT domain-containing protein/tetratricopeptide (TPR) repeat protein
MLRFGSFLAVILAACLLAPEPAPAQQIDIAATRTRHLQFFEQGRFAEALAEARKLETPTKARFGAQSLDYANVLVSQGSCLWALGRHREAEELYGRALPILEKAGDQAGRIRFAQALRGLASVYDAQGRYADAERDHKRALAILEATVGAEQLEVGFTLMELAKVLMGQARYDEAEGLYRRALAIGEKAASSNPRLLIQTLSLLASKYTRQGRAAEAEPLLKRALPIQEKALGHDHPNVAETISTLAVLYQNLGRYADAEPLLKRALAALEKAHNPNHPQVALALNNLGNVYIRLNRPADAEPLIKRGLAIREKAGPDHPDVATSLLSLAVVYRNLGRPAEGEPLLKRALAIREKTVAPDHPAVTVTLQALANAYVAMNRPADAEPIYARVLAVREKALGSTHPDVAATLDNLARVNLAANRIPESVKYSRSAVRVATGTMTKEFGSSSATDVAALRKYFDQNLAILRRAADARALGGDVTPEAFEVAQWINQSTAAAALAQMAARFGAGGDALAAVVRRQQDAASERRGLDRSLLAELAKASNQRDPKREEAMRQKMRELDGVLQQLNARIAGEFPQYADLLSPKPLKPAEVQAILGANEAMLLFHVSELGNYVWAITRERAVWREIKLKPAELDAAVQKLRAAIDIDKIKSDAELFDLGTAHALYREVLGPVEDVVAGKAHLIVVPAGALTSLPYHLLVTERPPVLKKLDDYRSAAWLVRKHAVTVLPSVASLKILREVAGRAVAPQAYLGFGDPIFTRGKPPQQPSGFLIAGAGAATRGSRVDLDRLSRALPQLPDTADELRSVARVLGAPASQVRLGQDANERAVRAAKLDQYRILHFATHALVAGETAQFTEQNEPALALTLPPTPSELDDGLLTSSEVAALKLNAEWVILSACNTAEGDKPGAEALSGLARAFFYAGAKTLLVSHWPVASGAAVTLTTRTIQALDQDRSLTPAEALRRSMVAMLDDTSDVRNAYPGTWAPFVIVGTGGRLAN